MTMMTTTIDQQLARLARDIAAADDTGVTRTFGQSVMEDVERRARSVARDVVEQLGATVEAGADEIDVALELVLARLMSPAPASIELLAA
jgi:hypothetical protein